MFVLCWILFPLLMFIGLTLGGLWTWWGWIGVIVWLVMLMPSYDCGREIHIRMHKRWSGLDRIRWILLSMSVLGWCSVVWRLGETLPLWSWMTRGWRWVVSVVRDPMAWLSSLDGRLVDWMEKKEGETASW